ncbi:MAG: hypothetical protein QXY49_01755 [Thermofilaceae archaeon]
MEGLVTLKSRVRVYPIFMVMLLAMIAAGSLLPAPYELLHDRYTRYNEYYKDIAKKRLEERVYSIFFNNLGAGLLMLTPVVGPFFATQICLETGLTLRAIALVEYRNLGLLLLTLVFLPITWSEMLAYAVALTESAWLSRALIKRENINLALTASLLLLSSALLLLSATFEALHMIMP